jgi:hypothetical protein
MLTREKVIETIKQLPSKFSIEEVIDRIFLLEKIEIGLQQSLNDEVTPDEELNKKLPGWLV